MQQKKFYEVIKIQNGEFLNVDNHSKRFNTTRNQVFGLSEQLCLWEQIEEKLLYSPKFFELILTNPIVKLTINYEKEIISFEPEIFTLPKIQSLTIVNGDSIIYTHKSTNKKNIELLRVYKGMSDEILIERNGYITDTCCCNVVLFDGSQWFTPRKPLVYGTKRSELISSGVIIEKDILVSDLSQYSTLRLINSMIDFNDALDIPISNISKYIQN